MRIPFLGGMCRLEIVCADTVRLLNTLTNAQLQMKDVVYRNDLTVELTIPASQYRVLKEIADKQGAKVTRLGIKGFVNSMQILVKRPVLTACFLLLFLATCYLPSRILFVSVEGNTTIPTKAILEAVENCGISFGTSRRSIRSEVIKNTLLQQIPQLQWAGVNTVGCTAIVSVKEKTVSEKQEDTEQRVSSIVAIRDGIIQDCTVLQGSSLCTVGQAVKAGQTLVSGYVNTGLLIRGTQADAEISALTARDVEIIAPRADKGRGDITGVSRKYSVKFGKNLINFYKDSGHPHTECVKIYLERYLTLPGGFRLPVALITETVYHYEFTEENAVSSENMQWLEQYAEDYLQSQMIGGQILSRVTKTEPIDGAYYLYGKYACRELIGKSKFEDTLLKDDRNDGTNRKL